MHRSKLCIKNGTVCYHNKMFQLSFDFACLKIFILKNICLIESPCHSIRKFLVYDICFNQFIVSHKIQKTCD